MPGHGDHRSHRPRPPCLDRPRWPIFVVRFDAAGQHLWSQRRLGGPAYDYAFAAAVDQNNNVVVTGQFEGTADFGDGVLTSAGQADGFVTRFDSAGAHLSSRRFGGSGYDAGEGIAVDRNNNVVVTRTFSATTDLGGGALTSAGAQDIVLARFDPKGQHLESRPFGAGAADYGRDVAADDDGNVVVTGIFSGTVEFGDGPLTSAGGSTSSCRSSCSPENHARLR